MTDSSDTTDDIVKTFPECPAIDIHIKTTYIREQSRPNDQKFVFAYTITLKNTGKTSAQLISRHWIIRDASNQMQEVKGDGVVGEQPVLKPGMDYTYTSGAILKTQTGTMEGSYQMKNENGDIYNAPIPVFALAPPHAIH